MQGSGAMPFAAVRQSSCCVNGKSRRPGAHANPGGVRAGDIHTPPPLPIHAGLWPAQPLSLTTSEVRTYGLHAVCTIVRTNWVAALPRRTAKAQRSAPFGRPQVETCQMRLRRRQVNNARPCSLQAEYAQRSAWLTTWPSGTSGKQRNCSCRSGWSRCLRGGHARGCRGRGIMVTRPPGSRGIAACICLGCWVP